MSRGATNLPVTKRAVQESSSSSKAHVQVKKRRHWTLVQTWNNHTNCCNLRDARWQPVVQTKHKHTNCCNLCDAR